MDFFEDRPVGADAELYSELREREHFELMKSRLAQCDEQRRTVVIVDGTQIGTTDLMIKALKSSGVGVVQIIGINRLRDFDLTIAERFGINEISIREDKTMRNGPEKRYGPTHYKAHRHMKAAIKPMKKVKQRGWA